MSLLEGDDDIDEAADLSQGVDQAGIEVDCMTLCTPLITKCGVAEAIGWAPTVTII